MTTFQRRLVGLSRHRRALLVLVILVAFPCTMFAPVITRLHDLTTGITTDYTLLSIEADLNGKSTTPLEVSHDLIQWSVLDALTPIVDGTYPLQYFFPPNTINGFFRLDIPQVQINSVQPFTIFNGGGTFFVTGQVFDPTYSVRIDGNPVTASFIDGSTFQVSVGPLSLGFHDITIVDSSNNVVATLSNGLFVTSTGRTDQESPPSAPLVNEPAFEIEDFGFDGEPGNSGS
ncbi:MAG: IPT/TIG domain-containing protein, partial [Chthoniobacterales bacterium]